MTGNNRSNQDFLFTSESVTEGHPDKVADAISDAILDAYLENDPNARVACETLVTTGLAVIAGEVSTNSGAHFDFQKIVRNTIKNIGYDHDNLAFSAESCSVLNAIHEQSKDIAAGVDKSNDTGAGDQGMMFGYACNETQEKMPLCISLAHKLSHGLSELRKSNQLKWLRPDGKAQVTVEYKNGVPFRIDTVVLSTQHSPDVSQEEIKKTLIRDLIDKVLPENLLKGDVTYHINPTGNFVIGGPHGDTGLTGRKIIVDTYGGYAPHGGGAFSGKDATKVDRSAAYMTRYIAKNIVASGAADKCMLQLAYAIGVSDPVSVFVDCENTEKVELEKIESCIREVFPLRPSQIIKTLRLTEPNFKKSTCYGHFGREDAGLTWENCDKINDIKSFLKI